MIIMVTHTPMSLLAASLPVGQPPQPSASASEVKLCCTRVWQPVPIGWQGPTQSFRNGVGLASFNGAYHFVSSQRERRLVPFVTAGYTRAFANQNGANLANYGAGFQYWFKENWAFRVEGRDHINTSGPVAHAWQIRLAIVFR